MRERGDRYFTERRVQMLKHDASHASAVVRGTERWSTHVSAERGALNLMCACPFFEDYGPCKHLWAVVLTLETSGMLGPMLNTIGPIDRAKIQGRAFGHGRVNTTKGAAAAALPRPPTLAKRWRDLAGPPAVAVPAPRPEVSWHANHRLVYVIDLANARIGDSIAVEILSEKLKADGTVEPPKPLRLTRAVWAAAPDPADRVIAQMLLGARDIAVPWMDGELMQATFSVRASSFEPTLRMICETGRARVRRFAGERPITAIRWDAGPSYVPRLRVRDVGDPETLDLDAVLERDGESIALDAASLIHQAGIAIIDNAVARIEYVLPFAWLAELKRSGTLSISRAELPALLDVVYQQPGSPGIDLPEGAAIAESMPTPTPCVTVTMNRQPRWAMQRHRLQLSFDYGEGAMIPAADPRASLLQPECMRVVHRNMGAERDAMLRLRVLGVRDDVWWGAEPMLVGAAKVIDRVSAELPLEGWRVAIDGVVHRVLTGATFTVSSGIDWFDLNADVRFGDRVVPLPILIQSLKRGDATVSLKDGSMGMLEGALAKRLISLAAMATFENGAIRFRRSQAALLDLLLATLPETNIDETFATARAELHAFQQLGPAGAPASFIGTLRPYQREGLAWLHFLERFGLGGCLADDMGLGKTIQVLALLAGRQERKAGASLVVVPRSLVFNWMQEAARFSPHLRVLDYSIAERRSEALDATDADLVLTTYGTLRRDAPALRAIEFDYVILDEAQAIKNAGTATSKAARLLRARNRLALSGTPVENRIEELWSLMDFLNPGMLGATSGFRRLMAGGAPEQREMLSRALRPVILRRTKAAVARDLPARVEQTLMVELEPAQRRFYDELLAESRSALLSRVDRMGIARSKILILTALLRLRQAACHPALIDDSKAAAPSAKLDALVPMLAEARDEGHKALVFSQFTSFLSLLRARLDAQGVAYEYLDGRTKDRQAPVERFQSEPACSLFLISLKAGGQGLNLTAADYVFLLDPWWNPAVEAQAIDRAHRIGQSRRVIATRLVARDTIEEKIIALQQTKRELAESILGEDKSLVGKIGREELEMLLG